MVGFLLALVRLLCSPITGIILQPAVTTVSYIGAAIASIWDEDIRADMNRINWNPFNMSEELTLQSKKVSFYKGVPVIRYNHETSGTFLMMFLANEDANDVRHEWGHAAQQLILGTGRAGLFMAIPSATDFGKHKWPQKDYYKRPYEASADILGGVKNREGVSNEDRTRAILHMLVAFFFGPFSLLFCV